MDMEMFLILDWYEREVIGEAEEAIVVSDVNDDVTNYIEDEYYEA